MSSCLGGYCIILVSLAGPGVTGEKLIIRQSGDIRRASGEKDLQVATDVNLPAIEKTLQKSGNRSVKIVKLPGLNHLFQHCKTGLPGEYSTIDETFSPEALKIIADWILSL